MDDLTFSLGFYIKPEGPYRLYSRTKVKIIKLKYCINVYFLLGHISNPEFTTYWLIIASRV